MAMTQVLESHKRPVPPGALVRRRTGPGGVINHYRRAA